MARALTSASGTVRPSLSVPWTIQLCDGVLAKATRFVMKKADQCGQVMDLTSQLKCVSNKVKGWAFSRAWPGIMHWKRWLMYAWVHLSVKGVIFRPHWEGRLLNTRTVAAWAYGSVLQPQAWAALVSLGRHWTAGCLHPLSDIFWSPLTSSTSLGSGFLI